MVCCCGQNELLEAKRALAAAPKASEKDSVQRLTQRLTFRNLLTEDTPKLAQQVTSFFRLQASGFRVILNHFLGLGFRVILNPKP